jgi:putative oxidoreductase
MGFEYGILVMRVILGLGLAAHGAQKLFGWFGGYGLAGTGRFFESIGFRPGRFFAALAGLGEFVGGLLIALGLLGAVGPMLIIAVMIVAIFAVHRRNGFFAQNNGFELPLIYAISAATYAFRGFGPIALDPVFGISVTSRPSVVWALLALGVVGGLLSLAARRSPVPQSQPSAT